MTMPVCSHWADGNDICTTIAALSAKICPQNRTDFYPHGLNSTPNIAYIFLRLHIASSRPLDSSFFAFGLCFLRQKIKKNFASPQLRFLDAIFMREFHRRCRHRYTVVATLTARCRNGKNYVQLRTTAPTAHNYANCAQWSIL